MQESMLQTLQKTMLKSLQRSLSRTRINIMLSMSQAVYERNITFKNKLNSKTAHIFLLCLFPLLFSSCAEYKRIDFDKPAFSSQDFKTFADSSVIYVFRNDNGFEETLAVNIDGQEITSTKQNTFFRVKVKPGDHEISSTEGNYSSISIKTKPGKNYFILQDVVKSLNKTGSNFLQVSELEGQQSIKDCRLIKTDN